MNNAVRQSSPQAAPSSSRRPTHASSATVFQLSASPGRKADPAAPAGADAAPARRRSRRGDLVFGGVLAVILLIACLTWEVLRDGEAPHATLDGARHGVTPAAVR